MNQRDTQYGHLNSVPSQQPSSTQKYRDYTNNGEANGQDLDK